MRALCTPLQCAQSNNPRNCLHNLSPNYEIVTYTSMFMPPLTDENLDLSWSSKLVELIGKGGPVKTCLASVLVV